MNGLAREPTASKRAGSSLRPIPAEHVRYRGHLIVASAAPLPDGGWTPVATVTWRRQDDDREEEYQVPVIPPARYFQAIDAQKAATSHGTSWADDRLTGMVRMATHRR